MSITKKILLSIIVPVLFLSSFTIDNISIYSVSDDAPAFSHLNIKQGLICVSQSSDSKEIKVRNQPKIDETKRPFDIHENTIFRLVSAFYLLNFFERLFDVSYFFGKLEVLSSCPHPPTLIY